MGDFNIEWHSNCSPRRILYEFLDNFELERLPFGTTHHQEFSDTTIDYICVSDLTKIISFDQKHVPHTSKHDFLWTSLAFTVPPTSSSTITRRCYKNVCVDRLLQNLEMADWGNFDRLQDVESKVEFLTSTLTAVYDAHALHRTFTTERKSMPWITVPIQRLISLRNKAWRNFKRNGNIESRNNYKGLRNHVQQVLRNAKHNFFRQKLSSSRNSTELWKVVNPLGIRDSPANEQSPFDPGTLNAHIVAVSSSGDLHDTRPTARISNDNQFYFRYVTIDDLIEEFSSGKSNVLGPDKIPLRHLKDCLPVILRPLMNIIDSSLQSGIFPSQWNMPSCGLFQRRNQRQIYPTSAQ